MPIEVNLTPPTPPSLLPKPEHNLNLKPITNKNGPQITIQTMHLRPEEAEEVNTTREATPVTEEVDFVATAEALGSPTEVEADIKTAGGEDVPHTITTAISLLSPVLPAEG